MSDENCRHIQDTAEDCPGLMVKSFTDDMVSYMNAADLVVSMGGYNTICEILSLKKRAIVVPRTEPVQEQWIRAQHMAQRGLLRAIHPAELTPELLVRSIREELSKENVLASGLYNVDLDGLCRVGDCIAALLENTATQKPVPLLVQRAS